MIVLFIVGWFCCILALIWLIVSMGTGERITYPAAAFSILAGMVAVTGQFVSHGPVHAVESATVVDRIVRDSVIYYRLDDGTWVRGNGFYSVGDKCVAYTHHNSWSGQQVKTIK